MTPIVTMQFGSHLYGTATASSDHDYKGVFIPPAKEILLQRVSAQTSNRRLKQDHERNNSSDVDEEFFSLQRYFVLLSAGQPLALDMLFAPPWAMQHEPHPIWSEIVACRHRLVSRKTAEFVQYCQRQAKKYGIKGSRIHALRSILEWFDHAISDCGPNTRLRDCAESLTDFIKARRLSDHVWIDHLEQKSIMVAHLTCCDKKASFLATLKAAREIYQHLMTNYGVRALQAETNQGVDWKALSHAVRISNQAVEFLKTGLITFPRPEAALLLAIKTGQLTYSEVAAQIEDGLLAVEQARESSTLSDEPDYDLIDSIVCEIYGAAVRLDLDKCADGLTRPRV